LPVTFGDASNYCTKMLTFKVVDFSSPYNVILGQPCYVMSMAIPNYAYLQLKIPRPVGVITTEARAQQALDCKQSSIELTVAMFTVAELRELSLQLPMALLNLGMPPTFGIFKIDEDTKAVHIGTKNPAKTV
jgi:hypothetical protein